MYDNDRYIHTYLRNECNNDRIFDIPFVHFLTYLLMHIYSLLMLTKILCMLYVSKLIKIPILYYESCRYI